MTRPQEDPSSDGAGALGTDGARGAGADDIAAQFEALQREIAALKKEELRLIADSRNLTQRLQRDKEESLKFAEADFARELLTVLDDLYRATDSAAQGADAAALAEGVRIAMEDFLKVLRSKKVEPIAAEGRPFDPQVHEAIMQQPSETVPTGHVVKEVARGFKMHERVLRPARVIVSTGPAAP